MVYLTLGTNTAARSQRSVKSLVLIYQQLRYFFLRRNRNEPCFRPASPFSSLNCGIILLAYRAFIPQGTSLLFPFASSNRPFAEVSGITQRSTDARAVFHLVNTSLSLEGTIKRASRIIQVPDRNLKHLPIISS